METTPEPPQLEPQPRLIAGFRRRVSAFLIDLIVLWIVGSILGAFFFDPLARLGEWGRLLGFAISLAYFGVMNSALAGGRTVGKRMNGIEVVDRDGRHISSRRALFRYAVFGTPFLFNGMTVPGYWSILLLLFVVSVWGGAIIYLYLFNRPTRQSLHDLAVGTYVVRTAQQGPVPTQPLWRGHLVWGSALLAVLGIGSGIAVWKIKDGVLLKLVAVQQSVLASGRACAIDVSEGENWSQVEGVSQKTSYFSADVRWKTRPESYAACAVETAALILKSYPDVVKDDQLAVTVAYGYSIGIASGWKRKGFHSTPAEWEKEIAKLGQPSGSP